MCALVGMLACSQPDRVAQRTRAHPSIRHEVAAGVRIEPSAEPSVSAPPTFGADETPPPATTGSDSLYVPRRGQTRFIVIGDYGWSGEQEQRVAELVDWLEPDFVLTTGDNNYPYGSADTIDENIGQYFSELIFPYHGTFASSATENRFFPALGNHDWETPGASAYLAYFTLPGKERYYDVVRGALHVFALDSDPREPDGVDAQSVQAAWLKSALAKSTSPFNIVTMHHPPYSSGPHGNTPAMQWPYREWGADLVMAGHDHCYERLMVDGLTYVVSGLGGASIYSFGLPVDGSQVRYNDQFGATVLDVDDRQLRLSFFDADQRLIDTTTLYVQRRGAP